MGRVSPKRRVHPALLGVAVSILALNLRLTMVSLPPLLPVIQRDLGLSGAAAGVLTALPVLCMALFAPGSHRLAHRFGREATTLASVTLVAVGNALRLAGSAPAALFGGTLIAGIGIAACGVVLPGTVKEYFPGRAGAATAAYLVAMMLGAAAAPAVAVPLSHALGSWEASLGAWALPGAVAVAVWIPVTRRLNAPDAALAAREAGGLPWRSGGAWLLAAFLSVQAALGYAYLAWISPAYEARGWSDAAAGGLLAAMNFAQLASALVLPLLADRSRDRRPALVAAIACTVLGALSLFVAPGAAPWVSCAVVGLGLGGGFSLGLVLVVDYAANPAASSRLAAMTFLVCYTTAAVAPVLVGALRDATGSFTGAFGLLAGMAVVQLALAFSLGPRHRMSVR
jgi:CP family cyanate transporter-like MFS transporter